MAQNPHLLQSAPFPFNRRISLLIPISNRLLIQFFDCSGTQKTPRHSLTDSLSTASWPKRLCLGGKSFGEIFIAIIYCSLEFIVYDTFRLFLRLSASQRAEKFPRASAEGERGADQKGKMEESLPLARHLARRRLHHLTLARFIVAAAASISKMPKPRQPAKLMES